MSQDYSTIATESIQMPTWIRKIIDGLIWIKNKFLEFAHNIKQKLSELIRDKKRKIKKENLQVKITKNILSDENSDKNDLKYKEAEEILQIYQQTQDKYLIVLVDIFSQTERFINEIPHTVVMINKYLDSIGNNSSFDTSLIEFSFNQTKDIYEEFISVYEKALNIKNEYQSLQKTGPELGSTEACDMIQEVSIKINRQLITSINKTIDKLQSIAKQSPSDEFSVNTVNYISQFQNYVRYCTNINLSLIKLL